jgi:hypothetical protein
MKTTTDYTDCTDYLAKATIILDFTDSCVPSVLSVASLDESGRAERQAAKPSGLRAAISGVAAIIKKNLCNQNL